MTSWQRSECWSHVMLTDEQFDNLAALLETLDDIETHVDIEWSGLDL